MRTVFKYNVAVSDHWTELELPMGAKLLGLQCFDHNPHVIHAWFEVESEAVRSIRLLRPFGTGQEVQGQHLGSVDMAAGALVWHVYERVGKSDNPMYPSFNGARR